MPGRALQGSPEGMAEGMGIKRHGQRPGPTGAELKAARKAGGLSQSALGAKAGIGRHAVSYWECRPVIDLWGWAVQRMAEAEPQIQTLLQAWSTNTRGLGIGLAMNPVLPVYTWPNARARAWGVSDPWQAKRDAQAEAKAALFSMTERLAKRPARLRVSCGAKTRAGGECQNKSEPGKRRCKFHGGKSTGAKTPEGKARIAEAQRRRWEGFRAEKARLATPRTVREANSHP